MMHGIHNLGLITECCYIVIKDYQVIAVLYDRNKAYYVAQQHGWLYKNIARVEPIYNIKENR